MRDYVIINGTNSNTITGLAINLLPPISKPPLRVMTEEIDGRDGDLISDLGYGSYDKTMTISLWGSFNIDTIIGFFNSEGTIVFSNEPDKYYNFKIINQIDYEALIKFRTATINLHCQPFKYPLTETPEEITTEYVEDEGETLTLNDTKIAPLSIGLKGNTSQTGTPTPSSPINVNVVSGDNEVVVCGKNLFNMQDLVKGRLDNGNIGYANGTDSLTISGNTFTFTTNSGYRGVSTQNYISVSPSTRYYVSYSTTSTITIGMACYDENKSWLGNASAIATTGGRYYDTLANTKYIRMQVLLNSAGTCEMKNFQLEKGSITTYEPYTSQNYPLYLGVENLFDKSNSSQILTAFFSAESQISSTSNVKTLYISCLGNTTYTISKTVSTRFRVMTTTTTPTVGVNGSGYIANDNGSKITITTGSGAKYLCVFYYNGNSDTKTEEEIRNSIQIEKGSKANSYTPYGTMPIELNKIGTYQDYIYKTDKWYLHKELGKVVLNGSETYTTVWYEPSNNRIGVRVDINNADYPTSTSTLQPVFCTRYTVNTQDNLYSSSLNIDSGVCIRANNSNLIIKNNTLGATATSYNNVATVFKNDITTNNMIVYYPLKTPVETEITDANLINQLEALKGAMSYEGQTNISGGFMIVGASALGELN